MKTTFNLLALVFCLLIASSFKPVDSTMLPWKKLGAKKVSYKLDSDVLQVGYNDGSFKKLKIYVSGGNLNMYRMIVEYGNGTKNLIPMKHNFRKGSDSRIIDLQGKNRVIKDITFWYDTKNLSRQRATVHVFGKK